MIITNFRLLRVLLRTRNKYLSINTQKMKLLPKATQRYVFSKKLLKLCQLCHILKIRLVIDHF